MNFYDSYKSSLTNAVIDDYTAICEHIINENIYAACLVIDEDMSGVFLTLNTLEYLQKKDKTLFGRDPFSEFRNILTPEEFRKSFGMYEKAVFSTKWVPDDWGYGNNLLNYSIINHINNSLYNARVLLQQDNEIFDFKYNIHKIMIDVLMSLKIQINKNNNDVFLFASVTDSVDSKIIESKSAKILNSESCYFDFIQQKFKNM